MSQFVLIDLDSQSEMVLRHTCGWEVEHVLKWMSKWGKVRQVRHPFDNHLYSFRSPMGMQTAFRLLDNGQLIIVRPHSMHSPQPERRQLGHNLPRQLAPLVRKKERTARQKIVAHVGHTIYQDN